MFLSLSGLKPFCKRYFYKIANEVWDEIDNETTKSVQAARRKLANIELNNIRYCIRTKQMISKNEFIPIGVVANIFLFLGRIRMDCSVDGTYPTRRNAMECSVGSIENKTCKIVGIYHCAKQRSDSEAKSRIQRDFIGVSANMELATMQKWIYDFKSHSMVLKESKTVLPYCIYSYTHNQDSY